MTGKDDYIEFLHRENLSESDVLPIWPAGFDNRKREIQRDIEQLINDNVLSRDIAQKALDAMEKDANDLLQVMDKHLRQQLSSLAITIPNAFIGVYPMNNFNARAVKTINGPLILLQSGFMEVMEAAANYILAERPTSERVSLFRSLIINYCERNEVPSTLSTYHPSFKGQAQTIATELVSQAEFFVLCHEYGHLAENHLKTNETVLVAGKYGGIPVIKTSRQIELEADLWSQQTLIKLAQSAKYPAGSARCGILFFLLMAYLIDKYYKQLGVPDSPDHPPVSSRISFMEQMLLVNGANDDWLWNQITNGVLAISNLVHNDLFGTPIPWDEINLLPPTN